MSADENPIIVTIGVCRQCNSVHTTRVYHRDDPEVWAQSRVDPTCDSADHWLRA